MVVATAGSRTGDPELLWQAISVGAVGDLPAVLRLTSEQFDASECAGLLKRSLELESNTRKALTIAQLGPVTINEPDSQDVLFDTLNSPELGAGAALVLSKSPDPQVIERLRRVAEKQDGLARQRASLAIHLRAREAGSLQ